MLRSFSIETYLKRFVNLKCFFIFWGGFSKSKRDRYGLLAAARYYTNCCECLACAHGQKVKFLKTLNRFQT